jgi:riboflavin synthase
MFTGIIEVKGEITAVEAAGHNKTFTVRSALAPELKVDQSLSHDGVCLTVESIAGSDYKVTAVSETLEKTTLDQWKPGKQVNLERAMLLGSRLDGHFVQGHVDCTGQCKKISDKNGSTEITITFPKKFSDLVIEKGSIALNGISLTVFDVSKKTFTVTVIPYTMEHTNLKDLHAADEVNLEFDMVGKYIAKRRLKKNYEAF